MDPTGTLHWDLDAIASALRITREDSIRYFTDGRRVSFIGAHVIDRALQQDKFGSDDMLEILRSGKHWDWGKNGDFRGMSGRGGALEISRMVTRKLQDKSRISTKQLFDKIMASV